MTSFSLRGKAHDQFICRVHRSVILNIVYRSYSSFVPLVKIMSSVSESPTLCSIEQCGTPFDVHCFHCRSNMCSQHYFEHKQQQELLATEHDDAMDDLLQRTSSKVFCISTNGHAFLKQRRAFPNPFASSSYLLKKMRQQGIRRPGNLKPIITTKTTAIKLYNLRKRPGKRQRKLVATKTTTVTTTTVKLCRTILKTRLKTTKLCNRKLPCPYHTVQWSNFSCCCVFLFFFLLICTVILCFSVRFNYERKKTHLSIYIYMKEFNNHLHTLPFFVLSTRKYFLPWRLHVRFFYELLIDVFFFSSTLWLNHAKNVDEKSSIASSKIKINANGIIWSHTTPQVMSEVKVQLIGKIMSNIERRFSWYRIWKNIFQTRSVILKENSMK